MLVRKYTRLRLSLRMCLVLLVHACLDSEQHVLLFVNLVFPLLRHLCLLLWSTHGQSFSSCAFLIGFLKSQERICVNLQSNFDCGFLCGFIDCVYVRERKYRIAYSCYRIVGFYHEH